MLAPLSASSVPFSEEKRFSTRKRQRRKGMLRVPRQFLPATLNERASRVLQCPLCARVATGMQMTNPHASGTIVVVDTCPLCNSTMSRPATA